MVKMSLDDFGFLAVSAVRYSLGRRTYAPSLTMELITPHIGIMQSKDLVIIHKSITQPWNTDETRKEWEPFRQRIAAELNRRGEFC